MIEKIKVGISACLLGMKVRYDGGHKLDHYLKNTLGQYVEWIPVCPEVEMGLPVPREPLRLIGNPKSPSLVTVKSGKDLTNQMRKWSEQKLEQLAKEDLCGFVFKSGSPSSGMRSVKVYGQSGIPSRTGVGMFALAFMDKFPLIPVEDDGRLQNPELRENFIERLFVFYRWKKMMQKGGSIKDLISFHTRHKLLILAHSPKHYKTLGKLVAESSKYKNQDLFRTYLSLLMEGLKLIATKNKNTNVLLHVMGYFKKQLTEKEKKELLNLIESYHKGLLPLIAPNVLLQHYASKYEQQYLLEQYYLSPFPLELMLRNHV